MTDRIVDNVDLASRTTGAIYLINAMTREVKHAEMLDHFNLEQIEGKNVHVNVELLINGVSVDFTKTLEEMWNRMCSSYDSDVLEKAKSLLSTTRFENLSNMLQQAESDMCDELHKLFPNIEREYN